MVYMHVTMSQFLPQMHRALLTNYTAHTSFEKAVRMRATVGFHDCKIMLSRYFLLILGGCMFVLRIYFLLHVKLIGDYKAARYTE